MFGQHTFVTCLSIGWVDIHVSPTLYIMEDCRRVEVKVQLSRVQYMEYHNVMTPGTQIAQVLFEPVNRR